MALLKSGSPSSGPQVLGKASDEGSRSVKPLELISHLLSETGVGREQIERLIVGLGPGSYTGIRSAIALAQGWQLARGVQLLGISTVEVLAAQAQGESLFGRVTVVIDAQRNELYLASYQLTEQDRKLVEPLRLADQTELARFISADSTLVGPEVTRWSAAGRVLFPDAAVLGCLAEQCGPAVPGEKLEPIYLREAQFVKAPPRRPLPAS